MAQFPYILADAFTERPLGGNPCAVVFDADPIPDPMRLAVTREMNLSETAFLCASTKADFGVRYWTPIGEIPMAGHPTIATVTALLDSGRLRHGGAITHLTLEMGAGVFSVEVNTQPVGPAWITMTQQAPKFLATYAPEDVLPCFGLTPADVLPDAPIQTVSTGTPQLMLPLRNHEALRRMRLDWERYASFSANADFFGGPHLFVLGGATSAGQTFARHPSPPPKYGEDPFTGSSTGGMAAYLWKYGLIDEPQFIAEQGHWMGRPGHAKVEVLGPRDAMAGVKVGGQGVVLIRGTMELDPTAPPIFE